MHSGFVNGHKLLCDARAILKQHKGTAALFLFYSLSSFSAFSLRVFVIMPILLLSWVPVYCVVCVNNLMMTADIVL